jgi:hypothetical protein
MVSIDPACGTSSLFSCAGSKSPTVTSRSSSGFHPLRAPDHHRPSKVALGNIVQALVASCRGIANGTSGNARHITSANTSAEGTSASSALSSAESAHVTCATAAPVSSASACLCISGYIRLPARSFGSSGITVSAYCRHGRNKKLRARQTICVPGRPPKKPPSDIPPGRTSGRSRNFYRIVRRRPN